MTGGTIHKHMFNVGPVEIDFNSRIVRRHGSTVHLSRLEFDLLAALSSPVGMIVTRDELLDRLWSGRPVADSRTLDTHIRRLRLKLEADPSRPRHLVTIRGVGFRLDP
ncbi:MAG TPA: winged helix-turn-helix domain-containing protein [Acidimicrobiales bacterium]|nr:winged helix-turn-helix domain-containing protein [Acidimicrobiales bacterium]